jgi:hypothetical protein
VLGQRGVGVALEVAQVTDDATTAVEDLDRAGGEARVTALAGQLVGDAVVVVVDLDVVVHVHRHALPGRVLVGLFGQRPQCQPLDLLEPALAGTRELLEWALVDRDQQLTNGLVGLGQAREDSVAQPRQQPALGDQHADFDFRLIPRFRGSGRDYCAAIVSSHIQVGGVNVGLVAVRLGDAGLQVVRDQNLGHTAEEGEGVDVARDPVRQLLRGVRVEVVAGAEHGDEELSDGDDPGHRVDDLQRLLAGEVDEQLLARAMLLPHDDVEVPRPLTVVVAELGVLIAVGVLLLVLQMEELQGHARAAHLAVHVCPIRHRA